MATGRAVLAASLILALLLFLSPSALAQSNPGTVKGTVVDKDGSPLPGVTVTLENKAQGIVGLGGVTNAQGEFRITPVPPGKGYSLRIGLPGYQKIEFTIEVYGGKTVVQNATLREEFKDRIRVEGKEETVNTESTQISTTLSSEFISGLPVLGTDYQEVLTLAPGVTDINNTGNPNIHGARDTDVVTLVDGASTTDPFDGHFGQNLNTESIEEIEVITSAAAAQYGRAQGGFVNILTKSGGNEFKGTFTFALRTSRLDGDGAGSDPSELLGGLGEAEGFRDMRFSDIEPYLSLSGAFVKDHLWYFFAPEYIKDEAPINAGTQAYLETKTDTRITGKLTWQVAANNKLSLTAIYDDYSIDNQGIGSLVALESGYTFQRGGPTLTLQDSHVVSPTFSLDTTIARFDQTHKNLPTTNPDTNGNGLLWVDKDPQLGGNGDGFFQLRETDPGIDWDGDGKWDVFEDFDHNGKLSGCKPNPADPEGPQICDEDIDHDGHLTGHNGCEGTGREDINCNGALDFESDRNENGIVDPGEDNGIACDNPDPSLCRNGIELVRGTTTSTAGNGKFDTEDKNSNFTLDDTPFPSWNDRNHNGVPEIGEFASPQGPDLQYLQDTSSGRVSGPYFLTAEDSRTRDSFREDLHYYIDDLFGSHELNGGISYEKEGYKLNAIRRPIDFLVLGGLNVNTGNIGGQMVGAVPTVNTADNTAGSNNYGLYFQDTFKPLTNLTLNLTLRFDKEEINSHGFTFFEPAAERAQYDNLTNYLGAEATSGDQNNDGVITYSLRQGDPLRAVSTPAPSLANRPETLGSELSFAAGGRLTRHNFVTQIDSELFPPGQSDILSKGTPRSPQDFTITNNNLGPRFSVSWDPWADGKTKATASWGRFYDKIFLDAVDDEMGPDTLTLYYRFDSDGVDARGIPDNKVGSPISKAPPNAFQVDRNMRTPFSDEWTIGFQREIAPEMSVGFNYISRRFRDQLQDIDVNHSFRRPGQNGATCVTVTEAGYCDDFGATQKVPPTGGGGEAGNGRADARVQDRYPDLYINNMNFNQILRVGNYNYQSYDAIELQFSRRLSRKWLMDANYVFSTAQGQAESFQSENGDDPSLTQLKSGYLDYDQRHVAKFSATTYLPADWRVGGIIYWSSGLPYSNINRFTSTDNVDYAQNRRLFGYKDLNSGAFIEEDRNIHRNAAVYDFQVHVEKSFVIGKASAGAFFDMFNILNSEQLRVLTIDNSRDALQTNYQYDFGRRFKFGFRMNF